MKIFVANLMALVMLSSLSFPQQAIKLSVDKAVSLALEKNTLVIQARNTVDAQDIAATAAVGALLPSLDFRGSVTQSQNWTPQSVRTTVFNGVPVQSVAGGYFKSYSEGAEFSSSLILFNGFANTSNVSRAKANANASVFDYSRAQESAIIQTHSLFLNVDRTYELLNVNEDNLKRSKKQLEQIIESNKVGSVALADVYRQQVQVGSDELNLIQAQSNFEKAKADLIAYLGTDFSSEYEFDFTGIPKDIDTTEFAPLNAQYSNLDDLVNQAIAKRPDYLSSVEALNSAEASVTMQRANYFPTISANGSYGWGPSGLSDLAMNQFTEYRGLSLSLSLNLPIFNGFATQSQIEQAQVTRRNADEQVQQNRRQVRVDIRKALLDLEAAEKQVAVSQTTITSAQMDREIAEEKYHLGAGTLLDLLVATANYTNAMSNKVNAVTGYILAKKQLEYVLGTISK